MNEIFERVLIPGLKKLSLPDDARRLEILERWLKALLLYNQSVNVIGTEDPEEIITKHVLDSLSALPHFPKGAEILDIGSGAGFPGVLLALFSDLKVSVNESKIKKCAFLFEGQKILKPFNLKVYSGNAAEINARFKIITARAFAESSKIVRMTRRQLAPGGYWLLYKGTAERIAEETSQIPNMECETIRLTVPGLDAERHLLRIKP